MYDDSGVSDVTSSSEQSTGFRGRSLGHVTSHMTVDDTTLGEDANSSEKWALVSHTLTLHSSHTHTHTHTLSLSLSLTHYYTGQ